jgi:hypothetical protein
MVSPSLPEPGSSLTLFAGRYGFKRVIRDGRLSVHFEGRSDLGPRAAGQGQALAPDAGVESSIWRRF